VRRSGLPVNIVELGASDWGQRVAMAIDMHSAISHQQGAAHRIDPGNIQSDVGLSAIDRTMTPAKFSA
jgi:hypothetical protein